MRLFPALVLLLAGTAAAECIPFDQAPQHVGEEVCVTGKVLTVTESPTGAVWFLNFCQDWKECPFSAVVFTRDLRDVGDVRRLEGTTVELFGKIKRYKGRPEIILKDRRQLKGEAANIPPLPKEFDADRQGRFSAGRFRPVQKPKTTAPVSADAEKK